MAIQLSRSERKRRIKKVEQLVRQLVELSEQDIKKLPCDHQILELFLEAQPLKGGTKKRQIKYITKILKNEPISGLYDFLARRKGRALKNKEQFHELKYFRDTLLNEAIAARKVLRSEQQELAETWASATIDEITKKIPTVDAIALSRLSAIFARTRQARHSREIFRLLRAAREQMDRTSTHQG
ncbi:MAG TPA: DUF615 domain-containing protein [Desulfobulbaceae bacterium]|nr:DUF615 domain-containing protein [Desulfobulbaceae bacterium]